jgi:hypothetical protein
LARPAVDRLEREIALQAKVVRLDILSGLGSNLRSRFDVRAVPTFVLLDGYDNELYHQAGQIDGERIRRLVGDVREGK